jgi:hypothetical protein
MNARRLIAALAIFAVVATGIGVSIAVLFSSKPQQPVATRTTSPPTPQVPIPAEFLLGVVVTDQKCDGSARCAYKYRVEPQYRGMHPLPDKEIKVVYRVTGGHQPQVGDFILRGNRATITEAVVEGPPGARLQASVTQVVDPTP